MISSITFFDQYHLASKSTDAMTDDADPEGRSLFGAGETMLWRKELDGSPRDDEALLTEKEWNLLKRHDFYVYVFVFYKDR